MPGNAFVYGTLMADEVLNLLIHRVPTSKPAVLMGYQRHRVKGQVFPAIIPAAPSSKVQGLVLLDLSDKELNILDVYETEEYYRQTVQPVLEDGSVMEADVYVWKDEYKSLLEPEAWEYREWRQQHLQRPQLHLELPDWDYPEFRQAHLGEYLAMTADFMEEFREQLA